MIGFQKSKQWSHWRRSRDRYSEVQKTSQENDPD
jgi:hypothetical protein